MDLRQLRLFLAVAEEGHFTRAAERVNLSQPALTHNIRQLEESLGVTLFERTPRGARLTPAGEALLPDAYPLAAQAQVPPAALHGVRLLPRLSEGQDAALLSKLGGDLKVIYRGGDVAALRGLVAAGEGVALLPSALIEEGSAGLTARPLAGGAPSWAFGLVWRTRHPSPLTTLAQRVIRQRVPRPVEL